MTMKILSLFCGLALLMFGAAASAHAHLQKSSPAENSVITTSPSKLELNFSEAARLTVLSIQKGSEPKQDLKPLPTAAAQQVSVPLPQLTPGTYTVSWRAVSDDGDWPPQTSGGSAPPWFMGRLKTVAGFAGRWPPSMS
jgi:methionine-rich copper-binding protein CopC